MVMQYIRGAGALWSVLKNGTIFYTADQYLAKGKFTNDIWHTVTHPVETVNTWVDRWKKGRDATHKVIDGAEHAIDTTTEAAATVAAAAKGDEAARKKIADGFKAKADKAAATAKEATSGAISRVFGNEAGSDQPTTDGGKPKSEEDGFDWASLLKVGGTTAAVSWGLSHLAKKMFGGGKDEKPKEDNGFSFGSLFVSVLAIVGAVVAWKHFNLSEKFGLFAKKDGDSPSAAVPLDQKVSFSAPTGDFVAPATATALAEPTTPTAKKFAAARDAESITQAAMDKAAGRPVKATQEGPVRTGQEVEHETLEAS